MDYYAPRTGIAGLAKNFEALKRLAEALDADLPSNSKSSSQPAFVDTICS